MRIIEPKSFNHLAKYKNAHKKTRITAAIVILAVLGTSVYWYVLKPDSPVSINATSAQSETQTDTKDVSQETVPLPVTESEPEVTPAVPTVPTLRIFAANDFRIFYDQLQQPNLTPVENPPSISGNVEADARIRMIAESRGYRLRASPSVSLGSVDGFPLQSAVSQSWLDLKSAAATQGLTISIVSSYRSVEHQRTLFLSRLSATGATIEQVAAGQADDKVNSVLVTSSIPGYSKHHTGYTLDILCAGWQFENFKNSPCNTWISADNFKAAKVNGFIPSYPPGADLQGPDPEAWEFVWVGTDLLYEQR